MSFEGTVSACGSRVMAQRRSCTAGIRGSSGPGSARRRSARTAGSGTRGRSSCPPRHTRRSADEELAEAEAWYELRSPGLGPRSSPACGRSSRRWVGNLSSSRTLRGTRAERSCDDFISVVGTLRRGGGAFDNGTGRNERRCVEALHFRVPSFRWSAWQNGGGDAGVWGGSGHRAHPRSSACNARSRSPTTALIRRSARPCPPRRPSPRR